MANEEIDAFFDAKLEVQDIEIGPINSTFEDQESVLLQSMF